MVDVSMGKERVRAWPRPRGANQAPSVVRNQMLFRNYSWAIKYLAPEMMTQIYDARQGMPLLPRDVAMMMLSGTLLWFSTPNGKAIYSMAALQAVSQSLDAIGQIQGSVLVRGEQYWEAVPYSPGGQPWWFSPPDMTSWTFLSGDGTQLTSTYDPLAGTSVEVGAISPGDLRRIAVMPIPNPASPWVLAARIDPMMSSVNFSAVGIVMRNSANGHAISLVIQNNAPMLVSKFTSLLNGDAGGPSYSVLPQAFPYFWQFAFASSYVSISISPDGQSYSNIFNEAIITFLGAPPDQIGVVARELRTSGFQNIFNVRQWQFAQ